jgi:hypothetical protein
VAAYQLIAEIFHEAQTRRQKLIIIFWVWINNYSSFRQLQKRVVFKVKLSRKESWFGGNNFLTGCRKMFIFNIYYFYSHLKLWILIESNTNLYLFLRHNMQRNIFSGKWTLLAFINQPSDIFMSILNRNICAYLFTCSSPFFTKDLHNNYFITW